MCDNYSVALKCALPAGFKGDCDRIEAHHPIAASDVYLKICARPATPVHIVVIFRIVIAASFDSKFLQETHHLAIGGAWRHVVVRFELPGGRVLGKLQCRRPSPIFDNCPGVCATGEQ